MKIKHALLDPAEVVYENHIFYQHSLQRQGKFEEVYQQIRYEEGRVYTDDIVRALPRIPLAHPRSKEWRVRTHTTKRLMRHIHRGCENRQCTILDIGCGNGWLCNHLASMPGTNVLGVDINETELRQAARVFGERDNLSFVYGNILSLKIPLAAFDYIILAATIPYFRDLGSLFSRLRALLRKEGEIHVLDSPIYERDNVAKIRSLSKMHFSRHNSALGEFYYHHSWEEFNNISYDLAYDPRTLKNRLLALCSLASPFPWLRMSKDPEVT